METDNNKEDINNEKKQDAKDISALEEEIKAGEWQRLKNFDTYKKRTRQGKIIAMHKALSNRIEQLEQLFYQLVRNHPEKAVNLLKEIKKLRFLKEYLLQCLIWEERGELENHDMPDELADLMK